MSESEVGGRSEKPLTRDRLAELFTESGVNPAHYSLYGASYNDADVLFQLPLGKWEVFYFERGSKHRVMSFDNEEAACREMLRRVLPAQTPGP